MNFTVELPENIPVKWVIANLELIKILEKNKNFGTDEKLIHYDEVKGFSGKILYTEYKWINPETKEIHNFKMPLKWCNQILKEKLTKYDYYEFMNPYGEKFIGVFIGAGFELPYRTGFESGKFIHEIRTYNLKESIVLNKIRMDKEEVK